MVYPALLLLMRTPRLPIVDRTEAPASLNRLVRFAERRNLVSARVPSHFYWTLNCRVHVTTITRGRHMWTVQIKPSSFLTSIQDGWQKSPVVPAAPSFVLLVPQAGGAPNWSGHGENTGRPPAP